GSAPVLHEDLRINGCSDSDGESMYALDAEEMWVADFKKGEGVYPLPPFIVPFSYQEGTYETAVANQQVCRSNLQIRRKAMKDIPLERGPPGVGSGLQHVNRSEVKDFPPSTPMLYTRDEVELGEKNILICHVSGFYPAPVNVSWTKNEQKVTEGTSINVPFPSKDSTFTQISRLDFIPQLGDVYSCSVEHPALTEPHTKIFDGFENYEVDRCEFTSTELKDIEFTRSSYYNKLEIFRFSSSLGKFVGYTDYGVKQANYFNGQTSYLESMKAQKETYCHNNIGVFYQNALSKSVEPYVRIHSEAPSSGGHPGMLVCGVYTFYPKTIKVSWLRNGLEITSGVTSTEELPDGDWYYQVHSQLEYTPR
ncbi:hypothetical protein GOODEAATRI_023305, partial [Goodea atripinnis]